MITNENKKVKKLDGLNPSPTSKRPKLQLKPSKKHARKHRGYIRGLEKSNGKTYYYYCYTPRGPTVITVRSWNTSGPLKKYGRR